MAFSLLLILLITRAVSAVKKTYLERPYGIISVSLRCGNSDRVAAISLAWKLWLGVMFLVRSSGWGKALAGDDVSGAKFLLGESPSWGWCFWCEAPVGGKPWLGVITLAQRFRCSYRAEKGWQFFNRQPWVWIKKRLYYSVYRSVVHFPWIAEPG